MNMLSLFNKSKNEVALRSDVDQILERMKALKIENDEQFEETGEFVQRIKGKQKEVKDLFETERKARYDKLQETYGKINALVDPLIKAEGIVKEKLVEWHRELKRKAAEEEQKRLAELKIQAEDRLLEEAEVNGDESILDEELMIPKSEFKTKIPTIRGVSFTEKWHFQIVDAMKIPREYLMIDERKIQDVVDALKANTKIDGIEVYSGERVGAKAKLA